MNYFLLGQSELFAGIEAQELENLLNCLKPLKKTYKKGEYICRAGEPLRFMGFVLSGSVNIERNDAWGNQSLLGRVEAGEVFGETYACVPGEILMVDVAAVEPCKILFLDMGKLLTTCSSACGFHNRLIQNLVRVMAAKNLNLSRKINDTAPKSIRGRLLSYLSYQVVKQGGYKFEIPFNRQQLADYLGVDRSAMSNELSKMQREGLIEYRRNWFWVKGE